MINLPDNLAIKLIFKEKALDKTTNKEAPITLSAELVDADESFIYVFVPSFKQHLAVPRENLLWFSWVGPSYKEKEVKADEGSKKS